MTDQVVDYSLSEARTDVVALGDSLEPIKADIVAVNGKVDGVKAGLTEIKAGLVSQQTVIDAHATTLSDIEQRLTTLESLSVDVNGKVDELKPLLTEFKTKLDVVASHYPDGKAPVPDGANLMYMTSSADSTLTDVSFNSCAEHAGYIYACAGNRFWSRPVGDAGDWSPVVLPDDAITGTVERFVVTASSDRLFLACNVGDETKVLTCLHRGVWTQEPVVIGVKGIVTFYEGDGGEILLAGLASHVWCRENDGTWVNHATVLEASTGANVVVKGGFVKIGGFIYVLVEKSTPIVFRSTDNGKSWSRVTFPTGVVFNALSPGGGDAIYGYEKSGVVWVARHWKDQWVKGGDIKSIADRTDDVICSSGETVRVINSDGLVSFTSTFSRYWNTYDVLPLFTDTVGLKAKRLSINNRRLFIMFDNLSVVVGDVITQDRQPTRELKLTSASGNWSSRIYISSDGKVVLDGRGGLTQLQGETGDFIAAGLVFGHVDPE